MTLAAEELLAGAALSYELEVPAIEGEAPLGTVRVRPLTVGDLQVVVRAAKESDALVAALMVQRALVEPELSVAQVSGMAVGLLQFLLERVNELSGIAATGPQLAAATEAPLARAAFVLAEEYGWTPQQVDELTLGQVMLHLRMIGESSRRDG